MFEVSQNGGANSSVSATGHDREDEQQADARASPRSSAERRSSGNGNGAFHAPKKNVAMSAEMMNTFTYSAKNRKPKRIPEYSVAKPATISESASVRSNGVRLASAVAAMKKISAPSGWRNTNQFQNPPLLLARRAR